MFIYSITLTKEKILLWLVLFLLLVLIAGTGISSFSADCYFTNASRRRFLLDAGWQTQSKAFSKETLTLPSKLDDFYIEYEALQNQQGLSLLPYLGKNVKKYTYRITNTPEDGQPAFANLLCYRGKLVACELVRPSLQAGSLSPILGAPAIQNSGT